MPLASIGISPPHCPASKFEDSSSPSAPRGRGGGWMSVQRPAPRRRGVGVEEAQERAKPADYRSANQRRRRSGCDRHAGPERLAACNSEQTTKPHASAPPAATSRPRLPHIQPLEVRRAPPYTPAWQLEVKAGPPLWLVLLQQCQRYLAAPPTPNRGRVKLLLPVVVGVAGPRFRGFSDRRKHVRRSIGGLFLVALVLVADAGAGPFQLVGDTRPRDLAWTHAAQVPFRPRRSRSCATATRCTTRRRTPP